MFLGITFTHSLGIFASNVSSQYPARLPLTVHLKKIQTEIAERHYCVYSTDSGCDSVEVYHYFANDCKPYSQPTFATIVSAYGLDILMMPQQMLVGTAAATAISKPDSEDRNQAVGPF